MQRLAKRFADAVYNLTKDMDMNQAMGFIAILLDDEKCDVASLYAEQMQTSLKYMLLELRAKCQGKKCRECPDFEHFRSNVRYLSATQREAARYIKEAVRASRNNDYEKMVRAMKKVIRLASK